MDVVVEFEHEGRTYRVRLYVVDWDARYLEQVLRGRRVERDELTGQSLLVDWDRIGVVRRLDPRRLSPRDPERAARTVASSPKPDEEMPPWGTDELGALPAPLDEEGRPCVQGWFRDPLNTDDRVVQRYWDGERWTRHTV